MKKIDKNYIEDLIEPYLEKINTICEIVGKPNNKTENIFIVSKGDIEYEDLIQNQCRGKCEPKNGYIYFRNDTELNPLIIIHEFIHRLSRKRLWFEWVIGIQYKDGKTTYFNEFLTEAITYKITGQKENNNKYNVGIKYIEKLFNRFGEKKVMLAYFKGKRKDFKKMLKGDYKNYINAITNLYYFSNCSDNSISVDETSQFLDKLTSSW